VVSESMDWGLRGKGWWESGVWRVDGGRLFFLEVWRNLDGQEWRGRWVCIYLLRFDFLPRLLLSKREGRRGWIEGYPQNELPLNSICQLMKDSLLRQLSRSVFAEKVFKVQSEAFTGGFAKR